MRTMKRRRSRASLLTSVLGAGVSSCSLAACALVGGSAPLHTMSQNSTRTHGSAWCWWLVGPGFRGLASPDPFLGAFRGVSQSWKMWRWFSLCFCWGTDSGMPVPQIMLGVEVAGFGELPQVQSWTRLLTCLLRP